MKHEKIKYHDAEQKRRSGLERKKRKMPYRRFNGDIVYPD